ncbi:transposase [Paenibacillus sp. MY03]|uniref:transposase n=1 Tax=Paenibacillus sp. MY03 TaxID=302980 RepID=UPI0015C5863A
MWGPIAFLLTGGQVNDFVPAIDLLQNLDITVSHIHGDRAYVSETICNWITTRQASYTIPPKANS